MIIERIADWLANYRLSSYYKSNAKDILVVLDMHMWVKVNDEVRSTTFYYLNSNRSQEPFGRAQTLRITYQGFNLIIVRGEFNNISVMFPDLGSDEVFNPTYLPEKQR